MSMGPPLSTEELKRDSVENQKLSARVKSEPIPTTLEKCRNHALYCVEKWVKKFEIIHPCTAESAVGFIISKGKRHPVYPKENLHVLRSRDRWLREMREVKDGEKPVKVVAAGRKRREEDAPNDSKLFGKWQTTAYTPRAAKEGIVPRGPYGNVELWTPQHLPPGTVHLPFPRIGSAAKKLKVDYAPAVVGFERSKGRTTPSTLGIVVCKEFMDAVLSTYKEMEENRKVSEKKKQEQKLMNAWKNLAKSTIIKYKLLRELKNAGDLSQQHDDDSVLATGRDRKSVV